MKKEHALARIRDNLYLVSVLTDPPMIMDMDKLSLAEHDPQFSWESLSLMITLEGKEAYEVAKAVCPPRRRILLPGGVHIAPDTPVTSPEAPGSTIVGRQHMPMLDDKRPSEAVSEAPGDIHE